MVATPWADAGLRVPLLAGTGLGVVIWINRLLDEHQNLSGWAILAAGVGGVVLHVAINRSVDRFAAVAGACTLALAGLQVGVSTDPGLALVPAYVALAVAAFAAWRVRDEEAVRLAEQLGKCAFVLAVLAGLAALAFLLMYLAVTADGSSWG